jgi:hypothetical protein
MPWLGSFEEIQRTELPVKVTETLSPATLENDSVSWKSPPV